MQQERLVSGLYPHLHDLGCLYHLFYPGPALSFRTHSLVDMFAVTSVC